MPMHYGSHLGVLIHCMKLISSGTQIITSFYMMFLMLAPFVHMFRDIKVDVEYIF